MRYHRYNLHFVTAEKSSSVVVATVKKWVTLRVIARAAVDAGLPENAVLASVSYLGNMSKEELLGE